VPSPRQILVCGAAVVVGLAAEWVAFAWHDPLRWLPDLLAGWSFVAAGLVASARVPESRVGLLLEATGFAWFAGNFAAVGWAPAGWLATQAAFLHRGLVIHCIVSFPTGRLCSWRARAVVAAGYAASLAPVARSDFVTMVVGAALVAGGVSALGRAGGRPRGSAASSSAVLFGCVLLVAALAHVALPAGEGNEGVLLAYQAALCLVALQLAADIALRARGRDQLADLVVELGESRSGSLRDGLSQALGDPTLEVGYWLPDTDRLVDAEGREVALPDEPSGRGVTVLERGGRRVAAIVHDPAVLDDPRLVAAVSSAAGLAAANARLHADVRAQLSELHASRQRLLSAGDEERRRLERRLHDGVGRQLTELAGTLEQARAGLGRGPSALEAIEEIGGAEEQLARLLAELGELARGLHPRVLAESGLAGALTQLAASCPVDVEVAVAEVRAPPAVEVAAYFVCAEAMANVAKYASASRAWIDVRCGGGCLTVCVRDDGVGGADTGVGTGLRGLVDRVEAQGGTLRVVSPPGQGTLLRAELPSIPTGRA
jgi:signal transduction histidine kinase